MTLLPAEVKFSGPVFDGTAERAVQRATAAARDAVAKRGVKLAEAAFAMSIKRNHGKFEHTIVTTTMSRAYVTGKYTLPVLVSHPDAVVTTNLATYGPWLEGTGSRNLTTRFKGYHGFRKATQLLSAEAREVADKAVEPYIREMN